ncbi:MAG TPA: hypothetical protein DHW45_20800 [Candidatus Latescibacteria bacterium]|nr:hypothetical protein [Candidatus Latescibacterota bacterium]
MSARSGWKKDIADTNVAQNLPDRQSRFSESTSGGTAEAPHDPLDLLPLDGHLLIVTRFCTHQEGSPRP